MQVEFSCIRQGIACDALQLAQCYKVVSNEKNDILEVGIEAAIQFAQRNAVRIGNVDVQVPKLTNADIAFGAPLWQRDKTFERDRLDMDFQFPGNLHDGLVKFVWMYVVADKVNIYGQARTSQQC